MGFSCSIGYFINKYELHGRNIVSFFTVKHNLTT